MPAEIGQEDVCRGQEDPILLAAARSFLEVGGKTFPPGVTLPVSRGIINKSLPGGITTESARVKRKDRMYTYGSS